MVQESPSEKVACELRLGLSETPCVAVGPPHSALWQPLPSAALSLSHLRWNIVCRRHRKCQDFSVRPPGLPVGGAEDSPVWRKAKEGGT